MQQFCKFVRIFCFFSFFAIMQTKVTIYNPTAWQRKRKKRVRRGRMSFVIRLSDGYSFSLGSWCSRATLDRRLGDLSRRSGRRFLGNTTDLFSRRLSPSWVVWSRSISSLGIWSASWDSCSSGYRLYHLRVFSWHHFGVDFLISGHFSWVSSAKLRLLFSSSVESSSPSTSHSASPTARSSDRFIPISPPWAMSKRPSQRPRKP